MPFRHVFIALIVILVIDYRSQGYVARGGQSGRNGLGVKNYQTGDNSTMENPVYPSEGVLKTAGVFVSKKIRQTVTLVKCVLKCFMQSFTLNLCSQMFPRLYDCFIGQEYIPPEVDQQIEQIENRGGLAFPAAFEFNSIFVMIKCIYDCATERQIHDWETFAYSLYCFADSCICNKIFNSKRF